MSEGDLTEELFFGFSFSWNFLSVFSKKKKSQKQGLHPAISPVPRFGIESGRSSPEAGRGGRPSGNGRDEGRLRSIADCRIRLFSESIMLMKILTCDCTNLMGQNHSNTVSEKQRTSAIENNDKVSYETIITWQQSFDNLMNHKQGQKIFAEFLKGEYSDENILFWQACEELKREKNAEKIEEKARIIYEDFISILSPKEVSLDSRVRETVNNNMQKPSANTFDDAQSQIYTLMQRDSYPRFLASPIYKTLVGGGTVEDL